MAEFILILNFRAKISGTTPNFMPILCQKIRACLMSIFKSGNSSESKIESVNGCKITGVASAQKTGNVAVTLKMIFFTL